MSGEPELSQGLTLFSELENKRSITRLPCYRRALIRLKELGFEKVFSDTLAEEVGVTSSQVRKDFSLFQISGNKKAGYQIDALLSRLDEILNKGVTRHVVLVGAGNIGTALINYKVFEKENIEIIAGFDIDPAKANHKNRVPVYAMTDFESFIKENGIKIGIMTVPTIRAQQVCDDMIAAGIRGILNFAPIKLKVPDDCVVMNVNMLLKLENLIYFVDALENKETD